MRDVRDLVIKHVPQVNRLVHGKPDYRAGQSSEAIYFRMREILEPSLLPKREEVDHALLLMAQRAEIRWQFVAGTRVYWKERAKRPWRWSEFLRRLIGRGK